MGVQDFRFCEGPNHWLLDGQTDTISEWKMRSARARLCLSFDRPSVFRPYRTHHRTDRRSRQGMGLKVQCEYRYSGPAGPDLEDDVLT